MCWWWSSGRTVAVLKYLVKYVASCILIGGWRMSTRFYLIQFTSEKTDLVTIINNLQPFWKIRTNCSETTRSSFALHCNWNKLWSYCGRGTACWQRRKALRALAIKAIWFPCSSTGGLTGCPFEVDKGRTYRFWRCYRGSAHFLWGTSV